MPYFCACAAISLWSQPPLWGKWFMTQTVLFVRQAEGRQLFHHDDTWFIRLCQS